MDRFQVCLRELLPGGGSLLHKFVLPLSYIHNIDFVDLAILKIRQDVRIYDPLLGLQRGRLQSGGHIVQIMFDQSAEWNGSAMR